MAGGKSGQTLFDRILPATAEALTSTAAVDWHLKAKNIEHVCLVKNYCITVTMQKITSIHTLIQQILGSHGNLGNSLTIKKIEPKFLVTPAT